MPYNDFTIGRDVSFQMTSPIGGPMTFRNVTGFDAKPQYNKIRSKGLDGVNRGAEIPDGWEGTIQLDRADDSVKTFFVNIEANYYAGQNIGAGMINETITNPDRSTSQYRYTGVVFSLADAGSYKGDEKVTQTVNFFAARCIKTA
jgi:hypothetical protein